LIRRVARGVVLLSFIGCATTAQQPLESLTRGVYVMGTVLEMTLYGRDAQALESAMQDSIELARDLDARMSRYDASSDVGRLNRAAGGKSMRVHASVVDILRRSVEYSVLTRGAFDVTVGPLVAVWVDAAERDVIPSRDQIAAALAHVGRAGILIYPVAPTERVSLRAGTSVDLGGIAKGYALDRMLPGLRAAGVESALLSFGQSSTWALGRPPDAPGWRLLVRAAGGGFAGIVTLRDQALSVSGSLAQSSEIGGRRFGHVLDPRSGWPLTELRQGVVVAPDATLAEALSTALVVLGEKEGIELVAAQPDCAGMLLDADGGVWSTPNWAAVTRYEILPEHGP